LIPPASYIFLRLVYPVFFDTPAYVALATMGVSTFFLFSWLFVFQYFVEYWLDVFILTDKRILDIDQKGLFGRTVSELRLYRTQDVTAEIKGFWRTMFDYGDIFIQTAGEMERFHFECVAHPNRIAKMILELAETDRKEHLEETVEEFGMPDYPDHEKVAKKMEP